MFAVPLNSQVLLYPAPFYPIFSQVAPPQCAEQA
jgi:hypothetical protein